MNNTIIKNIKSFFLNSYLNTLPFIDPQIVKELQKTNQKYTTKTIKLLNLYFYLNDINPTYFNFKNKDQTGLFNDFLLFITPNLVNADSKNILKAKQAYQNNLINIVNNINEDRVVKINLKIIQKMTDIYL